MTCQLTGLMSVGVTVKISSNVMVLCCWLVNTSFEVTLSDLELIPRFKYTEKSF